MSSNTTRFLLLLTATPKPLHHHRCPSLLRLSCHRRHLLPPSLCSLSQRRHYHPLLRSSLHRSFTHSLKPKASHQELHTQTAAASFAASSFASSPPAVFHPWPEWSNLIQNLYSAGYFNRQGSYIGIDGLVAGASLPEDFLRAAAACLAFAGDRPGMLGMLSRRDIEVVVANGTPFLFENADDSARRLKLFLDGGDSCVLSSDRLHTVDLMKFILSYASSMVSSETSNLWNKELVEQCVRNLLSELVQLSHNVPQPSMAGSVQNQFPDRYGRTQRPEGQNVEMKKGDWICPRCNFMNFARNVKCRECQEARPKRQLSGGEWECPQCDFFNYGRNTVCLRCDCKRPGETLVVANSSSGLAYGNSAELDSRLAANEEKAQKWFSKMSQLDSTSDMNGSLADEDFPEIMPLRKGVNRFVVSTRKTPLERRLANAQYRRNVGDDCTLDGNDIRTMNDNKTINQTTSRRLEEILGRKSVASTDNETSSGESAGIKTHSISNSASLHNGVTRGSNSKYVPSVSLPAGMFANKPVNVKMDVNEEVNTDVDIFASTFGEQKGAFSGSNQLPLVEKPVRDEEKGQGKQTERWFKKVAELHNVTDLTSATSDDGFHEIMSLHKGDNRFEVSNKNNGSLSSPKYNRRMATERANNTNYVPSVPFPPDYFAKDNQQHNGADSTNGTLTEYSNSMSPEKLPENVDVAGTGVPDPPNLQEMRHQQQSAGNWSYRISGENLNERKMDASYGMAASGISTQNIVEPQRRSRGTWSSGYTSTQNTGAGTNLMGNPVQNFTNPQASRDDGSCGRSWKQKSTEVENLAATTTQSSENQGISSNSWTGKSLEGSAVKEPDPLDMSEEAKAERWFRRVAQIKDISELSQIPDEDFPSIMPMRKGVNRFVVSKRKTPLERRLTSTQYRRNLPVVNSDPVKENDSS